MTQPTGVTGTITAKQLTVAGVTATNKVYDGATAATVNTAAAVLAGVIAPDIVNLSTAGATGTFNSKNVGTGKAVTVSGLAITGTNAGNYTLRQPTTTADITAKTLTISGAVAQSKQYDGNDTAIVSFSGASLAGVISPDLVSINSSAYAATFNDKNVGNGKPVTVTEVTLSGADATNYTVSQPTGLAADITPKNLTIGGAEAQNKPYDGTATATVSFSGVSLVGKVSADDVSINSASYAASFNNKTVGTGKPVTVTGVALSGTDAANYTVSQPTGLTADITAKSLTIAGAVAQSKQYDGNNTAAVNFGSAALVGVVTPDIVNINSSGYVATFNDKNVATGKPVTVSGVSLSGADAGNYAVSQPSGLTANITATHITGAFTAPDKQYDGTTAATRGYAITDRRD